MRKIQIINTYHFEPCYLCLTNGLKFHICDHRNNHIDGYFLFSIYDNSLSLDYGIGEDDIIPMVDIDANKNYQLIINGVDEI